VNPQRRSLLLAGLAVAIAVIALIVALTTSDDGGGGGPAPTRTPSAAEAQLARDRQQIARLAESFQRALDPKSADNPCRYMTRAAQASALEKERQAILEGPDPTKSIGSCADVVRKRETTNMTVPLYQATPRGVTDIQFRRSVPSARAGGSEPGAIATWRATGYGQVSFVRDEAGQWRIAE
jgi:hypothetical protein